MFLIDAIKRWFFERAQRRKERAFLEALLGLCQEMPNILRQFKGTPPPLPKDYELPVEGWQWEASLEKMAEGFEAGEILLTRHVAAEDKELLSEAFNDGMELFMKFFGTLISEASFN